MELRNYRPNDWNFVVVDVVDVERNKNNELHPDRTTANISFMSTPAPLGDMVM